MEEKVYRTLEAYMLSCMEDSAHDREHVYRVLYNAMEIARWETGVRYDILIAACLLHDIGRKEQFADPGVSHAEVGAEKAFRFLTEQGFPPEFAAQVRHCVLAHRYRTKNPPETLEAKILFDADKLDATGAMGIARTLLYQGIVSHPLYRLRPDGTVSDGADPGEGGQSFFGEYRYKLENLYGRFYTARAQELAENRRSAAEAFYESLLGEVRETYGGRTILDSFLE